MIATRIFLCHDLDLHEERQFEVHIFQQLCQKLQKGYAEIILCAGRASDEGFLAFFLQHVSTCQWFLLFQTESAVESAGVQSAVSIAKMRVEQRHMQGIVRFIALPGEAAESPQEWSNLLTFGATPDYQRALEKLLLALSLDQESAVQTDPVTSPPVALRRTTEGDRATPVDQWSFHDPPLLAPPPPVVDLITAPLPAMPAYKYTQVDPPAVASLNPAPMCASDQPVKLPLRVPKRHMVL
ncbi:MAG: hypothetical protein ACRDHW_10855, partial [Ktedonobacteraceae bacterium]